MRLMRKREMDEKERWMRKGRDSFLLLLRFSRWMREREMTTEKEVKSYFFLKEKGVCLQIVNIITGPPLNF